MRNIEKEMPLSIKSLIERDEELCKRIGELVVLNVGATTMSPEEVTLRARLRQVRACLADILNPENKYGVETLENENVEAVNNET